MHLPPSSRRFRPDKEDGVVEVMILAKIKKITYVNLMILLTLLLVACESGNDPPIIIGLHSDPAIIEKGANSTLTCLADDPDVNNLDYTWQSTYGSIARESSNVIWTAPD